MGDSLVGKITVTLVFIAPEEAADLLRGFFDDHKGFMVDKSKKEGVLKHQNLQWMSLEMER